jgi:hypothetical protein
VPFNSPNLRAETGKTTEYHGHYIPNNNHYEIGGMCKFFFMARKPKLARAPSMKFLDHTQTHHSPLEA